MRRRTFSTIAAITCMTALAACSDTLGPGEPGSVRAPGFHVGVQPKDLEVGRVANDVECHVGQRGFPTVVTNDSHVVESASGVVTLTCRGQLPAGTEPDRAVVEENLLCFLPEGRQTRDSREIFTPSGQIILVCHFNPNGN